MYCQCGTLKQLLCTQSVLLINNNIKRIIIYHSYTEFFINRTSSRKEIKWVFCQKKNQINEVTFLQSTHRLYWLQSRTSTTGISHLQKKIYHQSLSINPMIMLRFIYCLNATVVKGLPFPLIITFIKFSKMHTLIQVATIK